MEQKQYFIVACVVLIGIMIGSVGLVYILLPKVSQPGGTVANPNQQVEAKPEVHLYKKAGGLILQWSNLPKGTQKVTIYRAKVGTEDWKPWKTFEIDATTLANGYIEIKTSENLKVYIFYTEAVTTGSGNDTSTIGASGSGAGTGGPSIILWQSSTTVIEALPPNFPGLSGSGASSTTSSTTPGDQGSSNTTTTTPDNTPGPSPTSSSQTPSSTTSGSGLPSQAPTGTYYTPDGKVSGTNEIQHNDFWVDHVNQSIEVGWQNIPATTNLIIVYRSTGESGPWLELFRQDDPTSPSSLRLLDNTLHTAHYYRMEALHNNTILKTYPTVFLPALE